MDAATVLAGLFVSAFVSSTILPGNSEIVLAAAIAHSPSLLWPAVTFATIGNTAGGMTSWLLGRLIPADRGEKLAPRAIAWARRWGVAALLLSWVPIIGDALCVASGWLRQDWRLAAIAIAAGKFVRYVIIALGTIRMIG